jgi:3-hydroxyacyl-CoA dehydrogenase
MVHIERRNNIAIVTIANPPVNSVSGEVAAAISSAMDQIADDSLIEAIVMTGAGSTFIAGADIKMLSQVVGTEAVEGKDALPDLNGFLFKIENSRKPVVMAIHGVALGGGLEVAMAGHYRVALPDAKAGQPEVNLGLIPGMGGTQRLPRLAGPEQALQMCVLGEPIDADAALRCGLLDSIVEGNLLDRAIDFARSVIGTAPRVTAALPCPSATAELFTDWRAAAHRQRRGQHAPLLAIDAIEAASQLPFAEGFALEQKLFDHSLRSTQAKAMIHFFLAERTAAKVPGLRPDAKPRTIRQAAVVGAGFMGTGIAMRLANAGIPVLLKDITEDALQRGMNNIRAVYQRNLERGRPSYVDRIQPQLDWSGFEKADLVIEAVFESLTAKQEAFSQISRVASPLCILATNTSTLDIDAIASASNRPHAVAGLHFFSPAHIMRLLEIVRGAKTSDETITTLMGLSKQLGKIAVLARNAFGFIGNRMVMPYLREAHALVEEGASVEQVDRALYDFGMAMGPLAMEDMVGLDVTYLMRKEQRQREHLKGPQPTIADRLYEAGRYGQKTGAGWSRYDAARRASPDPFLERFVTGSRREITDNEIRERCLNALVREGKRALEEGIALRASDIDIVYVHGYGFPVWRGGPMFYAERSTTPSAALVS